ncbi:MAG: NAD(+) synthase [Flavobacteriaceae bacterium]
MKSGFQVQKVNEYIVEWLKSYAQKARVKGFVVGISGGIDSAVTSFLCAQTGLETLCVEMPIHQASSQVNRGKEHIKLLKSKFPNLQSIETDLTSTFEEFKKQIPQDSEEYKLNLTLANTRSRLRMLTLYYHAGIHSFLVAGTGNKIEDFGVGFYTKYGDGGVDISPIADLMKSEVYKLAEYLGVPDSILVAPPTDGLFGDNRSDEDQLGASYDELEKAMIAHENEKKTTDFSGREKEVFEIYVRLNSVNQHKMNPIPVCVIPKEFKS